MFAVKAPGTWTYEDLFELPDDRRFEIIDGKLYEMPAPEMDHALAIANLMFLLSPVVRAIGGRVVTAPVDVFFIGANPVQPDIVVLLPDRLHFISDRGIEGAPSLLIEIVSPTKPERDRHLKRDLYARGGVPEYWLVDPKAKTIEVLTLVNGNYVPYITASGDDLVTSLVLSEISFPASAAFA